MNKALAPLLGFAISWALCGCNPSPSDPTKSELESVEARLDRAEVKLKLQQSKEESAAKRAQDLRSRAAESLKQSEARKAARAQTESDALTIGQYTYKRKYDWTEITKLAADDAISMVENTAPRLTEKISDPGYRVSSERVTNRGRDRTYSYDSRRTSDVERRAKVWCEPNDIKIEWSDKDHIYWATCKVTVERSQDRIVYFYQGMDNGEWRWYYWRSPAQIKAASGPSEL